LATCDERREIKLWSLPSFEPRGSLLGHQGKVSAIVFSPDSRTLLSSSHDGTVKAWSVLAARLLMNIHLGDHGVSHIALSQDGRRLAVIEDRRRLRIYAIGA
jgi:WD40 repeat protein